MYNQKNPYFYNYLELGMQRQTTNWLSIYVKASLLNLLNPIES